MGFATCTCTQPGFLLEQGAFFMPENTGPSEYMQNTGGWHAQLCLCPPSNIHSGGKDEVACNMKTHTKHGGCKAQTRVPFSTYTLDWANEYTLT